ncbi:Uncharacterised protein [Salmonella enterica subsp. salamae]|uniref:Uncharacterized protein n=1 Tax=Salmonella enterica TaxID=28901 RepID=A0A379SEB6_SALER|nr:Uncharacterised protein [Salmonella enterica]SUJ09880.1 Uncharacterised protein [Salmonella enterica subsp. salamae]
MYKFLLIINIYLHGAFSITKLIKQLFNHPWEITGKLKRRLDGIIIRSVPYNLISYISCPSHYQ